MRKVRPSDSPNKCSTPLRVISDTALGPKWTIKVESRTEAISCKGTNQSFTSTPELILGLHNVVVLAAEVTQRRIIHKSATKCQQMQGDRDVCATGRPTENAIV
jgi:hypothetical protein